MQRLSLDSTIIPYNSNEPSSPNISPLIIHSYLRFLRGPPVVSAPWVSGAFISLLSLPSLAVLLWTRREKAKNRLAVYQRPWLF